MPEVACPGDHDAGEGLLTCYQRALVPHMPGKRPGTSSWYGRVGRASVSANWPILAKGRNDVLRISEDSWSARSPLYAVACAPRPSGDSADLAVSLWQATGKPDRAQLTTSLNKLVTRWPEVPPATLTLALALASSGYHADDLTSLLHLTRLQARTVLIAVDT